MGQAGKANGGGPALTALSRPVPLSQVAYDRIRRGLSGGGELTGVGRLIEQDLAARFAMSRTPVREALHRLALMGFLEPSSGGGYVRRTFRLRAAREHFELRQLLEPPATARAARRPEDVRAAAAAALKALAERDDPSSEAAFHVAIVELSGNTVLARVVATISERLVGFGVGEGSDASVRAAHRSLVSAVVAGDERSQQLMAAHLAAAEEALVARIGDPAERVPREA